LELHLKESGKSKLLAEICNTHGNVKIHYVYQEQLNGLGGAVSLAESFAGNDPVAVLLGDTVLDSATDIPVTGQLIEVFKKFHSSVIALEQVVPEKVSNYGIADIKPLTNGIMRLNDLIEKPALENAPSNFAVASRYVFTPGIFAALRETAAGLHNEIQLTDAIRILLAREKIYGWQIAGKRFDLGNPAGFIAANIEYAMRRPELQRVLEPSIKNILNN
jgi:UTP--glucose-1-phosphate uridylyltransferase